MNENLVRFWIWKVSIYIQNDYKWMDFRMEKLELRLRSSQAKTMGTVLSVAGALFVTLYKGQPITNSSLHQSLRLLHYSNWVVGGILCAAGALCISVLYIIQVPYQIISFHILNSCCKLNLTLINSCWNI